MQKPDPWPITAEMRQHCVAVLMTIAETGTPEEQCQAIETLIQADALNIQVESPAGWLGNDPSPN